MFRLDVTLSTLAENLALDEALLVGDGPGVLRFWSWPSYAVVVGAGGKIDDEAHRDRCLADNVPIARRGSGGGTVLLGPGCLLYSLILPMDLHPTLADLNASYRFIMGRLADALAAEIPGVTWSGISDLVLGDRKFSGNAQQRKRDRILHHGTILHAFDRPAIDRYVKHPPRMPDYRRDRPHDDFVVNLPLAEERVKAILANAWDAHKMMTETPDVARFVNEKYGRDDWRDRR